MSVRCKMEPKGKEPLYLWAHRMVQEGHSAFGGCGPCTAAAKFLRERKARNIKDGYRGFGPVMPHMMPRKSKGEQA